MVFPRPNRPQFEKATSRDPLSSCDPLPGGGSPARKGAGVPARGILRPTVSRGVKKRGNTTSRVPPTSRDPSHFPIHRTLGEPLRGRIRYPASFLPVFCLYHAFPEGPSSTGKSRQRKRKAILLRYPPICLTPSLKPTICGTPSSNPKFSEKIGQESFPENLARPFSTSDWGLFRASRALCGADRDQFLRTSLPRAEQQSRKGPSGPSPCLLSPCLDSSGGGLRQPDPRQESFGPFRPEVSLRVSDSVGVPYPTKGVQRF